MEKLTVSQIIANENIMLQKNKINVIVAPAGSGKTYYIFNQLLNSEEKSIYLCDTSNLKEAILRDEEYFDMTQSRRNIKFKYGFYNDKYNCTVMTYAEYFYHHANSEYANVKTIICDEIHNLFKYKDKFDNEECENYSNVIEILKEKSKEINVVGFTATHDRLKREMDFLLPPNDSHINLAWNENWNIINLSNHKDIKKLEEKFTYSYQNYQNLLYHLKAFNEFKKGDKCVIYTDRITTALEIVELCNNINLNAIALWSLNNENHIMSTEQLKVRNEILTNGMIPEKYQVLIINSSYETGININDTSIKLVVVNSTNKDTQIQARSRIRHNILALYVKSKNMIDDIKVLVPPNYLDKPLTTKDKNELVKELNIYNENNRLLKWTSIQNIIINSGYTITNSRITKKRICISTISKNFN